MQNITNIEYLIPLGKGITKRHGSNVTIITYSRMTYECLEAAWILAQQGIQAEAIDIRTLKPLDMELIAESVRKTRHVIIAHEACLTGGFGAEIAARIEEELFDFLDTPVRRVAAKDVPIPFSPVLEKFVLPQAEDVLNAVYTVLQHPSRMALRAYSVGKKFGKNPDPNPEVQSNLLYRISSIWQSQL